MQNRPIACLAAALLLAASSRAQCFTATGSSIASQMTPTGTLPADDEGLSPDIALNGLNVPFGSTFYTHLVVDSNGVIYFTNGSGAVNRPTGGIRSLADLRGGPGGSPRVAPFSGDFEGIPGSWDILIDDTTANEVKVTWTGLRYATGAAAGSGNFSMSAHISSSGHVRFDYSTTGFLTPTSSNFVGVSAGNNVGTAAIPPANLSSTSSLSTTALVYQNTWPPFDLAGTSIRILRAGNDRYVSTTACGSARHTSFGTACAPRESFHQMFSDAAVSSATLTGNGILLTPTASGYRAIWLPQIAQGLYQPPTAAATNLPTLGEGEVTYPLGSPLMTPFGTFSDLTVHANGIIAFGPGPVEAGIYSDDPSATQFASASHGGVYSWHDYDETEGGDIWAEEPNGYVHITFENVEAPPAGQPNPNTFQVQFNKATGEIWMLFVAIAPDSITFSQDHLVGYTAPGPSTPTTSIDLTSDLPRPVIEDRDPLVVMPPLPFTSTSTTGSSGTYTIANTPETAQGSGVAAGLLIFSTASPPGGLDLGPLGAPGCYSYVADFAATISFVGPPGPQSLPVTIPAGVLPGTVFYTQAAALLAEFNDLGLMTSRGIETTVSSH